MAYRRPFTPQQRRDAIGMYRSYQKHRALLLRQYPPLTTGQWTALDEYGKAIHGVAALLRVADRRVDVDALNEAELRARKISMEYFRLRLLRERGDE